jgi:hypothetical protein
MLRTILVAFFICVLSAADTVAQTSRSPSGQFRTGGFFYEKSFDESEENPRQEVWAGTLEIRFEDPLANDDRLRAYARIELQQYRELGSSPGALVGVKRRGRSHSFDVYGAMQWNRPRLDVGDDLETADLPGAAGSYTYRIVGGLQLTALAEYREEFLKPQRITGSRIHELGAMVSYRGPVTPEVTFDRGLRKTGNPSNEYVQEGIAFGVRSSAIPRVSMNAHYRQRRREYTIQELTARNLGRVDQRDQITAGVDISSGDTVSWNLSGAVERGDSTRPGRGFISRTFTAGFTLTY